MAAASALSPQQQRQMVEQGWLRLRGKLAPDALAALQAEASRVEDATRPAWQRHIDAGTEPEHGAGDGWGPSHHVVYPCMGESDVFPELLAHPAIVGTLHAFMGATMVNSDNGLCIKPAQSPTHVGWHRDAPTWDSQEVGAFFAEQPAQREFWEAHRAAAMEAPMEKIKVMIFLDDIGEKTAPFSIVPGSHRLRQGEPYIDAAGVEHSAAGGALREDPASMPGHITLTGQAGDILLWNGALWHAAMDNTDTRARKLLLYNFVHWHTAWTMRPVLLRTGRTEQELEDWLQHGLIGRLGAAAAPSEALLRQLMGVALAPPEVHNAVHVKVQPAAARL